MEQLNVDSYVSAIDNKNISELEKIVTHNKNEKRDIIFEMYNNNLLTIERLKFIMENCTKYFNISSNLIKMLMRDENVTLLDIIFDNINFYDNELILQLLLYYKNKKEMSIVELEQKISLEKYKISKDTKYSRKSDKYLVNECDKCDININIVKYLVEHGTDINKESLHKNAPLFYACFNGNINLVKYLVKCGVDINKENENGSTPLFYACIAGNIPVMKYLIEHGADINKENKFGETPLFNSWEGQNDTIVRFLFEHGANINKENTHGETPLFNSVRRGQEMEVKYFVEHGAIINKEDKYGNTPLFYARTGGNEALIEYLIEHGAI